MNPPTHREEGEGEGHRAARAHACPRLLWTRISHLPHASPAWAAGLIGEVMGFDRGAGRYEVQMSTAHTIRVKLENVVL